MATSGDFLVATNGDFLMAMGTLRLPKCIEPWVALN
jgi:hypothetical protein